MLQAVGNQFGHEHRDRDQPRQIELQFVRRDAHRHIGAAGGARQVGDHVPQDLTDRAVDKGRIVEASMDPGQCFDSLARLVERSGTFRIWMRKKKCGLQPGRGARIVGRVVVRWCRRSRSSTTGDRL